MAYTWTTGEVITADKLNATGGGDDLFILTFTLTEGNDGWEATCDKTFAEASAAFEAGKTILAKYLFEEDAKYDIFQQYTYTEGTSFVFDLNAITEVQPSANTGYLDVSIFGISIVLAYDDTIVVTIQDASIKAEGAIL